MPNATDFQTSEKLSPLSARDVIAAYFGFQIRVFPRETTATVGTTAVQVTKHANQRVAVTFGNNGSNLIVVGFSPNVTTTNGYPVAPNSFLSFTWFLDGELTLYDFWAISGTAGQTLYVVQSILQVVN